MSLIEQLGQVGGCRLITDPPNGSTDKVWVGALLSSNLYKSTDGGVSFTAVSIPVTSPQRGFANGGTNDFSSGGIWVDPSDPNKVVVCGVRTGGTTPSSPNLFRGFICKTTDGFATKTYLAMTGIDGTVSSGKQVLDFAAASFNGLMLVGLSNTIPAGNILAVSTDGGSTWTEKIPGVTSETITRVCIPPGQTTVLYACANNFSNNIYKSTNGGISWTGSSSQIVINMTALEFPSPLVGYVGNNIGIVKKTVDGGNTWSIVTPPGITGIVRDIKFFNDNVGYVATSTGKIFKTTDGGATWNAESHPQSATADFNRIFIIPDTNPGNISFGNRVFIADRNVTSPAGRNCGRRGS